MCIQSRVEKNSRDIRNTGHWQAAGLQSSAQVRRSLTLIYFCLDGIVSAFGVFHYPRVFPASRDFIKKIFHGRAFNCSETARIVRPSAPGPCAVRSKCEKNTQAEADRHPNLFASSRLFQYPSKPMYAASSKEKQLRS